MHTRIDTRLTTIQYKSKTTYKAKRKYIETNLIQKENNTKRKQQRVERKAHGLIVEEHGVV